MVLTIVLVRIFHYSCKNQPYSLMSKFYIFCLLVIVNQYCPSHVIELDLLFDVKKSKAIQFYNIHKNVSMYFKFLQWSYQIIFKRGAERSGNTTLVVSCLIYTIHMYHTVSKVSVKHNTLIIITTYTRSLESSEHISVTCNYIYLLCRNTPSIQNTFRNI